ISDHFVSQAREKSRSSQQLAAQALVEASVYPSAGLGKALQALDVQGTPAAQSALLTILAESRLRAIVPSRGSAILALLGGVNGRDAVVVNPQHVLRIWKWPANQEFVKLGRAGIVTSARFADAGRLLFTASKTRAPKTISLRLWDISTCKRAQGQSCRLV